MAKAKNERRATGKQIEYARGLASGKTQREAYILAYAPKAKNPKTIDVLACRRARNPLVMREVFRLRQKSERSVLLTVNDRLKLFASIALDDDAPQSARVAAGLAYGKTAGDEPPTRQEVSGVGGGPIQVAAEVTRIPLVRRLTARERLEDLQRQRALKSLPKPTEDALANPS